MRTRALLGTLALCHFHMLMRLDPPCRRAGGLRCLSLTSELGEAVATLTPALLEAVLSFQPPPRQQQRQRPRRRRKPPKPRPPLAELLPRLFARAPQQVCLPLHVLCSSRKRPTPPLAISSNQIIRSKNRPLLEGLV
jgi:hypothetical protein